MTLLTLFLSIFVAPAIDAAAPTAPKVEEGAYKEISTQDLKSMMDSKKSMVIFDARRKLKGGLLPGAKNLPYDADDSEYSKTLGSLPKNATIVVYCANMYCPLSKYLAEHLVSLGYTNVYKYTDGVAGWLDKDYPLDPIKKG